MKRVTVVGTRQPPPAPGTCSPSSLAPGLWLIAPRGSQAWIGVMEGRRSPKWQRLGSVSGYLLAPWRTPQPPRGRLVIIPQSRWWRSMTPLCGPRALAWRCIGGEMYEREAGRLEGVVQVDEQAELQPLCLDPPRVARRSAGSPVEAESSAHMPFIGRDIGLDVGTGTPVGIAVALRFVRAGRGVTVR